MRSDGGARLARIAVGGAGIAYLAWIFGQVRDPLDRYAMKFPDSFDWLTNGLRYAGLAVEVTWRAMLMPLVYAGLFLLGLDDLIPAVGPVCLAALAVVLLTLGWQALGWGAVYATALLLTNHFVLSHALVIGSDTLAVGLGATAVLAFHLAVTGRPRLFVAAGAAIALAQLAQPASALLIPALGGIAAYDPEAKAFFSAGALARVLRRRELWLAGLVALGILVGSEVLRGVSTGVWFPRSLARPVRVALDQAPYYAWSSVSAWSIPVAALAAVGGWLGLRRTDSRRWTIGLLLQIAAAVVFFTATYQWRDNRFVLYWTVPALLLAGHAIDRAPLSLRLPLLAVGLLAGNLTTQAEPSPIEPEIVWSLRSATVLLRESDELRRANASVDFFSAKLASFVGKRRLTFADPNADDVYYSASRAAIAREAVAVLPPGALLRAYVDPQTPQHLHYILRNDLVLLTRHPVTLLTLEPASARLGEGEIALLLDGVLSRHPEALPPLEVLSRFGPNALVRARASTPALAAGAR